MIQAEVLQALETIEQYEGVSLPYLGGSLPNPFDPLQYEDITTPSTPAYDDYNQASFYHDLQTPFIKGASNYNAFESQKNTCGEFMADFDHVNTLNNITTDPVDSDPYGCHGNGYKSDASTGLDTFAGTTANSADAPINIISTSSEGNGSSDSEDDKFDQNESIPVTVNGGNDANIKQRMADKIRQRRESQGVGEIPVAELFLPSKQYPMTPEEMIKDDLRKKRNRQSAEKSRKKRIAREKLLEKEHDEEEEKNQKLLKEIRFLKAVKHLLVQKIKTHGPNCELRKGVGNGGASGESPSPSGLKRGSFGAPAGGESSPKVSRSSESSESSYSRSFLRTSSASCTNRGFTGIAQQSTVSNVSSSSFPLLNAQSLATAISAIASVIPSIARQDTWPATINTTSAMSNPNPSVSLPVVTSPPPYPGITRQQTTTENSSNFSKSPEEEKEAIRVIKEGLLNGFALSR